MKRKINILISAVLILLILPVQFGCNKDKLLQETEEQAIVDANDDMPFPDTDPDGNPIAPADLTNSENTKGLVPIKAILLMDGSLIDNDLDSWDKKCQNSIYFYHANYTNFYTLHYYKRNSGSWINSGWKYHSSMGNDRIGHIWDVSFREGDVIQSYAYTWQNGTINGSWGPTHVIENPASENSWEDNLLDLMLEGSVAAVSGGVGIIQMIFNEIMDLLSGFLSTDAVIFHVVDQDGNPLHAETMQFTHHTETFLGSMLIQDGIYGGLGTQLITCYEPDGPESYDNNLNGRTVTVDISQYDNEDYWGKDADRIPVIKVTFNTNGTTTVDYPEKDYYIMDQCSGDDYNQAMDYILAHQSFTPTFSTLTAFEIFVTDDDIPFTNEIAYLQIRKNSFTGNIIASSNSETIDKYGFIRFNFIGGVQLTPETKYFMTIVCESGQRFAVAANSENPYDRGECNYNDNWDIKFRTYGH
ncbi:MAG: hypothetical protein K8R54_01335 [Bacteroidales bacterium]|nr:hypothetical protein [Bacteroidales bacterium]